MHDIEDKIKFSFSSHTSSCIINFVHAHFLTNNLNGPPIKYSGSIDYLIN